MSGKASVPVKQTCPLLPNPSNYEVSKSDYETVASSSRRRRKSRVQCTESLKYGKMCGTTSRKYVDSNDLFDKVTWLRTEKSKYVKSIKEKKTKRSFEIINARINIFKIRNPCFLLFLIDLYKTIKISKFNFVRINKLFFFSLQLSFVIFSSESLSDDVFYF